MIFHFLFYFSFSVKSSIPLVFGKNQVSVLQNQRIKISDLKPQTIFLFVPQSIADLEIIVEADGKVIGNIDSQNFGIHFGVNSGSITIRSLEPKTQNMIFYYLPIDTDAAKYYISTYKKDAFVISYSSRFTSCKVYKANQPIVYMHVTGLPQKVVSSSSLANSENTVILKYTQTLTNEIKAKATEPITAYSEDLIYFIWNSEVEDKQESYKITTFPDSNNAQKRAIDIPEVRYEYNKKSKTSLISINHNYGVYTKYAKSNKAIPMDQISDEYDGNDNNNEIRFSFDSSAITILFSLIGIIVILLIILIYVGLMPVPSSSAILNTKPHYDEEALLKDSDKSPELSAYLRSNK